MGTLMRNRFPRSVYDTGSDPDPRFTLANERTLLAWLRTSLALLAAGVALETLGLPLQPTLRLVASVALVVLAIALPPVAWLSWAATERAMRRGEPLPSSVLAPGLTVALPVIGLVILAGLLLG
ncbi:YidH family protein [Mycolicibacterium smegmatis]|uniref:Inner membrane protein n=3 Tax=Mycolicibacterium smegmatis TaxID=1772 RepID=A0QNV2_MYCS2|nr:DUF202 domain-containing protein [Mycolicibacterium smegmatis]ABK72165.1 putative inner membrane protein [Mycolicibacterium smegmatis MC2 155]AFP36651.1 hypothetical protein MSMEI_0170 [Mycolicibacterium smegmatis MC2 155]AIU05455.1 membrane protein [Mycolicibacterium smegmatis MC2 155]AIU12080.1 membrane protein [Mycolicibacterium smegmatis]AIU18704.1 membrane protein [Mycolicibacterium smegmatis]